MDADLIGHFELVPIEALFLRQRQQPLRYLLVSTMEALPLTSEDQSAKDHQSFVQRVEFAVSGDWIAVAGTPICSGSVHPATS